MARQINVAKTRRVRCQGFTLIELLIAFVVALMVSAATIYSVLFTLRSYQALTNYQQLNETSQFALDNLSTDIRECTHCDPFSTFTSTEMTLDGTDPVSGLAYTVHYVYSPNATTLTRTYFSGTPQIKVLLTNCTYFAFSYFQRNPSYASFDVFTNTGNAGTCKVVQVDWSCTRNILGSPANSQVGESARIVIRN